MRQIAAALEEVGEWLDRCHADDLVPDPMYKAVAELREALRNGRPYSPMLLEQVFEDNAESREANE